MPHSKPASTRSRRQFIQGAAAALSSVVFGIFPTAAAASDAPVKMLVGFPPGGSGDLFARILADALREELSRPVIIENKPGGGGMTVAIGEPTPMALVRHIVRRGLKDLTVIGSGVALLISGAVVTESVYAIPGLGRLTIEAVLSRDFPTVQAVILLFSGVYVVVNLLIDITYTLLDPRIRY